MKPKRILVVDDDESLRRVTQLQLEEAGYSVLTASNGAEALPLIEEENPALVITDLKMPGLSGLDLLKKIRDSYPEITVVLITAFGTVQTAVEAMKAGAYDYMIRGETGTGKELLAKAIHQNSPRKERDFVTINCGAIPKDLLESELFGHAKGSFTGAFAPKRGKVEMADGGTLFLDEIGELPLELQVKLLRLIQHGEIEKVGSTDRATVDVRIIAATHRNLMSLIEDGAFREDLYYRLAVIPLELPALRERVEDIPELVQHLFLNIKQRQNLPTLRLPPALVTHFCGYRWPGNVRELENVIERLVVLSTGEEITAEDLPEFLRREKPDPEALHLELPAHGISLEAVEKELIQKALQRLDWNQTRAANFLDISRRTLIYRMEKHGIQKGDAVPKP